jgi:hypothetical protein
VLRFFIVTGTARKYESLRLRDAGRRRRLQFNHGNPAMSANKRPSSSSLRRFITSRPYVTVAELRRRFGLDDPDAVTHVQRNGTSAWIGLPEREAAKLQELWNRDELGMELSVDVRAPVVVGIYPMRIARYVMDGFPTYGASNGAGNGHPHPVANGSPPPFSGNGNGSNAPHIQPPAQAHPSFGSPQPPSVAPHGSPPVQRAE